MLEITNFGTGFSGLKQEGALMLRQFHLIASTSCGHEHRKKNMNLLITWILAKNITHPLSYHETTPQTSPGGSTNPSDPRLKVLDIWQKSKNATHDVGDFQKAKELIDQEIKNNGLSPSLQDAKDTIYALEKFQAFKKEIPNLEPKIALRRLNASKTELNKIFVSRYNHNWFMFTKLLSLFD